MQKLNVIWIFLIFFQAVKADQWEDPSWKQMLSDSDAIALVEYVSDGEFRARAKIVKVYKGRVSADTIWISGYSNRYGPIDKMSVGERYIVFINKIRRSKRIVEYWENRVKEDKELLPWAESINEGTAYYVWSPTSGDLKVQGSEVQYDLIQSTYSTDQEFYPLVEFERFLGSRGKRKKEFQQYLVQQLQKNNSSSKLTQSLMMLVLTSYDVYESIYEEIFQSENEVAHFALARLLGNIKDKNSKAMLVKFLDSKNSLVQGEAVRQLSNEDPDFIGPILLSKLESAGEEGLYRQNLMNPVLNSTDGGKIEIIKALGEMKYSPAIPKLLPLLETENEYVFKVTFKVLDDLGTREYIPYLSKILELGTSDFIDDVVRLITDKNLTECLPALMHYISNHDRSEHPDKSYTVSWYGGLGQFDTPEVRTFLTSDFEEVMSMERGEFIDNKKDWIQEYIETFAHLKMVEMKPLVYDSMFEYYGFNSDFRKDSTLFLTKKNLETNFKARLQDIENLKTVDRIEFLLQFNTETDSIEKYSLNVVINNDKSNWEEMEPIFNEVRDTLIGSGFKKSRIRLTTGYMVQDLGGKELLDFDDGLMNAFLAYVSEVPDKFDLLFLKHLSQFEFVSSEYEKQKLNRAIEICKSNLK